MLTVDEPKAMRFRVLFSNGPAGTGELQRCSHGPEDWIWLI